jgi:hypothetical protein
MTDKPSHLELTTAIFVAAALPKPWVEIAAGVFAAIYIIDWVCSLIIQRFGLHE